MLSAAVGCALLFGPGPSSAQTVVTLEQCVRASLAANHGTVLPAALGLAPLAFALEEGGELLRPMAAAAIGGLLFNVAVELLLVPVLYTMAGSRAGDAR